MKTIKGRIWVFGHDVNTDVIHPPQFFSLDPARVKSGLFHGYDPSIQPALQPGDIFIGGHNFGCGSSRETSMRSLKLNQVGAIVALDFARIFFRNATNNGLPCLTFADPADREKFKKGMLAEIVPAEAKIVSEVGEIKLAPPGAFIQEVWAAGGLLELLPKKSNVAQA
ncbi:3-isopropylmalate dehydratase small subunit [Labilithrix luteola]|uniref:3-isopropylmalate dehydratase small subunit n=1 Tax=Labilithrix luteola TaxID=1391654 RepID=A0A0K1PV08_9BACT|nr:aconitate hydratase [Labilithrix luteola]AKU97368.1 3-isopropylmalate dehydratase small subunit [Labilithrix luteola]